MKKQFSIKNAGSLIAGLVMLAILFFTSATTAHAQTLVKNIVLVHGAFAGGSGWECQNVQ